MKTTLSIRLHTATWIVAFILALVPLINQKPFEQFVGTVIATIFWMAVYYLFFIYIAPAFLLTKKLLPFFSVSIIILLFLPFIGYSLLLLSKALFQGTFAHFYNLYSVQMHISGFKALALAGLYGSFFRLIVEYFSLQSKQPN
jgi:hypothetical protein